MKRHFLLFFLVFLLPFYSYCDYTLYTIQRGDTLYSIAQRYNVTVEELQELNGITDPTIIRIGTVLKIPNSVQSYIYYTIKPNDTLYSISRQYNIEIETLIQINDISDPSKILVGMVIKIPSASESNYSEINTEDQTTELTESSLELFADMGVPFWPHPGEIIPLEGKLEPGIAIMGNKGDFIYSVSKGQVTKTCRFRGFGNLVFIKGENGYIYVYGGQESILVSEGDIVEPGTELGILGVNPHDNLAKVFFFITKDGKPIDTYNAPRN